MKYMNNPFVRKLFAKARFAADDGGAGDPGDGGNGANGGGSDGGNDPEPSIDELKIQLAKARAQADRYKNSIDNLTKKNGELTKQNRQFMSDEQKAQADQEERDKELAELRKEVRVTKYSKKFVGLGMDEESADEMAGILPDIEESDKFFETLGKHLDAIKKAAADEAVQKLLENRPDINSGNGNGGKASPADEIAVELAKRKLSNSNSKIADHYKI